ncbi:MAG: efflux transporter outer membrane subunit, partial [Planctomycetota bacterium]
AGLRIQEAMAIRAVAAGNFFPQLQTLNGSFAREQISTLGQPRLTPLPEFSRSFDAWSLSGNLSWELDFWGRFRRAVEAADANLEATVNDYDAMLICLIAEVVTAYVDIQTFQERLVYARNNVKIQEGSLQLAQERFDAGKTDRISVRLSRSNLEATRATIPTLEIGLRQANNRLCVLLGIPPRDLKQQVQFRDGIPDVAPEVVVGIPADLLRRRPDVRAAERLVAAQSAEIGIALSELYPQIAVTGNVSVSTENFSDLFKGLSQGGSVGPSFQWNVLNYGRIINNARAQDARFLQLVASYQNTVLVANREVEDALISFLENQKRVRALARSAEETKQALELALIRFREG